MTQHYIAPRRFEMPAHRAVAWLARHGLSLFGAAELSVPGRTSGAPRHVPVNPLRLDGGRYLVSARGNAQWVRNLRAAGGGQLRKGRGTRPFTAVELLEGEEKAAVLRAYLGRWGWEVGAFFDGVTATSPDAELTRIAPMHPVFLITATDA
ncbi:nitroreductase family deazaflavin-dependent oxidoreductase [Streptomyces sp. NPDC007983]|uniref:nitroreductase family deazaflavin-dependent oxidoreductase n=1 Tax=Streptomyces sp. NPDC007983 TaxID=3364800 RepID=UPI0036ED6FE2